VLDAISPPRLITGVRIMRRAIPKLLIVCIGQALLCWLFYRSRAVAHFPWADSDFLVFVVPLLAGFAASALVLFRSGFAKTLASKRGAGTFGLAAACAMISSFLGTAVAFSLYGT
jgi:hypothetical protein